MLTGWLPRPSPYALAQVLVFSLGVWLRIYGIESLALTFDEGATLYFAHLPMGDLWGPPAWLETNPPLFYTIERNIVRLFGDDPFALRLVPVIAGALCAPVAAIIAKRQGGRLAGIAAALLVATSTLGIERSQEARTYSLFTLAALVTIAGEVSVLQFYSVGCRDKRVPAGGWVCYVTASIAAVYLHNTATLMVVALNLVAVFVWVTALGLQRRFAMHWIAANAVILIAYSAWVPIVFYQSVHTLADFWIAAPTLIGLRYAVMSIYAQPFAHWLQPLSDLLFVGAGVAGILAYRSNRLLLGLAIFVVLGVPLLTWSISQWRPLTNGKTLVWLTPVFLIFVALGATYIRRLAVIFIIVLVTIQAGACYGYFGTRAGDAFPEMAQILRSVAVQGDTIYLHAPADEILLAYMVGREAGCMSSHLVPSVGSVASTALSYQKMISKPRIIATRSGSSPAITLTCIATWWIA
jgi:uncharacterized membrane protein